MAFTTRLKINRGSATRLALACFLCVLGSWQAAAAGVCPPPAEIDDSVVLGHAAGVTTISWNDPPDPYAVYCGTRAAGAPWEYNHRLLAGPLATPSVTDSDDPPSEGLVWYLVSRQNACGQDSAAGQATDGTPTLASPLIDVLPAVDNEEVAAGVLVPKNIDSVTVGNFDGLKFNMRPFKIDAKGSGGTTTLSVSTPGIVEIFEQDGTPVTLPANVASLPVTWLINGLAVGETLLRVDHAPAGAPASFREVRLRVECFPGLGGEDLSQYPFFDYPDAFNQGGLIRAAIDPVAHAERVGLDFDIYVVPHRTTAQWAADNTLSDATGTVENASVGAGGIESNRHTAWSPATTAGLYDVVFDFYGGPTDDDALENTPNGLLDPGDLIGLLTADTEVAEVNVVSDPGVAGPLAIATYEYDVGPFTFRSPFDGLVVNYTATRIRGQVVHPDPVPANAPLVVIAHGQHFPFMFPDPFPNGPPRQVDLDLTSDESYRGHTYLQTLLASHGFVTVSVYLDDATLAEQAGLSGTGLIRFRGWTILKNIEAMLNNAAVAGPTLGQIDPARISLVGHSRGGEGVLQAFRLLNVVGARPLDGGGAPEVLIGEAGWNIESIASISAVSFINDAPPGGVADFPPYLVIYGTADGDVEGLSPFVRPYTHYDRANGDKQVITVYGANHNYFNTSWPCGDATGVNVFLNPGDPGYNPGEPAAPFGNVICQTLADPVGANLTTAAQQRDIARGYVAAFLEAYARGREAHRDFFSRPPSRFRPPSVAAAVELHNQYRLATGGGGIHLVMDDYESNPSKSVSSSGQSVAVVNLVFLLETSLAGPFPPNPGQPADRFTQETTGAIAAWSAAGASYTQTIATGNRDLTQRDAISFRIAQQPLQPQTTGLNGDMELTITLEDEGGMTSSITTSVLTTIPAVYSARVPFSGPDSSTEAMFKTLRFDPCLFKANGREIDLTRIELIRFDLTPSSQGRFGLDELELTDR